MASTEGSSGAAVSMKAEKANKESLAKKKSAIKAELEKTAAELEEIEQLKAEAEDLEDEEMLSEMQAEEQRLQGLRQQYTAELESIQQQQVAAQQALRQRFKRLTGDRAASFGSNSSDLGASGKSTLSDLDIAQPAAAANSAPPQAVPTEHSSTYTTQPAAPYSSDAQGVAADTAQTAMPYISYAGPSAMSNQPLSASWGAAPLQTTTMEVPPTVQPSILPPSITHSFQHAEHGSNQPAQQQPDFARNHYSASTLPQEGGLSHITASTPALGDSNHQLDFNKYSPQAGQQSYQEPVAQSENDSISNAMDGDHARTEDVQSYSTSNDMAPVSTEADQSMSRNLPDLSKPPRPASSLAGQQGLAKTGNVGQQPSGVGMLHDRSGSKASMLSAGSGYQADSDSNSDVPVDPQTAANNLSTPPFPKDTFAGATRTRAADEPVSESDGRVAETGGESEEKSSPPSSMLGKIGHTVWGAVEAITGHSAEPADSVDDSNASAKTADTDNLHAESSPAASQKTGTPHAGGLSEPAAAKEAELTQVDSGYEAGEEGPVQAGPEGPSQAALERSPAGFESEHNINGFRASPPEVRTSTVPQQDAVGTGAMGIQAPCDAESYTESAAESGGMAGSQHGYSAPASGVFQEPLHVHTDPANSKRGISGIGSEQPGSASKRARGDSTVAKLINSFDSPNSEPISPSLSSQGSGSVAGRKFFTGSSFNDGQGGFTQGISPTQGRAASGSLASNQGGSPFAGGATHDTLGIRQAGSRTLPEEESYLQSTRASQGSIDTNRDLAIISTGSVGNQSELTKEATGMSYTQPLSDGVSDSAAELAQPVSSTAGTTAGTSAMSSLPPSASWGAAVPEPSPTPAYTRAPTPAVTQQPAEAPASEPYQHSSVGLADTVPEQSSSTAYGEHDGYSPITHEAEVTHFLPDTNRQGSIPNEMIQDGFSGHSDEPAAASLPLQDAFTEQGFEPATTTVPSQGGFSQAATTAVQPHDGGLATQSDAFTEHSFEPAATAVPSQGGFSQAATTAAQPHGGALANQSVVEAPGHAEEQELQMQQAGLGQTAQAGFAAQDLEQPTQRAQHGQVEESVYQAQGADSAQALQHGFAEDSMREPAQLEQVAESAYTAQGAAAVPAVQDRQAGFSDDIFAQFSPLTNRSSPSQQANPFATVASPVAQEPVLESAQPVEPSMKEQVILPAQQVTPSSSAGSHTGRTPFQSGRPGSGMAERLDSQQSLDISSGKASPRRRPPPPPQGSQSAVGRTSSLVPSSPTQAPVESASFREGVQQQQQQQQTTSPLASHQEAGVSLFAGKTAFDEAVKPEVSAAPQAAASQSAFGAANEAGTGPDFGVSSSEASTAPKGEPLASWYSFEDPGPLPPMPTPTAEDTVTPSDRWGLSTQSPVAAPKSSQPATTKQPETQASIDPWAAPIEPSAEVKATESEVMAASLAGLEGDAWGGSAFGQDMGQPMAGAEPTGKVADTSAKGKPMAGAQPMGKATDTLAKGRPIGGAGPAQDMSFQAAQDSTSAKSQAEPLKTQPSWMQLANSSNPFSQFIPMDNSGSDPNPWAATSTSTPAGFQQSPAEQPGPVAYPAVDDSRHPDASGRLSQQPSAATTSTVPQQQQQHQYPAPPTGVGAQQPAELDWAAFGPGGQASQSAPQQQQPAAADDIWSSLDRNQQQPPQKQEPRAANVDSWASFDAPSDLSGLGAPVASQQTSQGISNVDSQDPWSAFDPGNSGAGSRAGAAGTAGFPSLSSQQPRGGVSQPTSADRKSSVEEIPAQDLGLEGLRITAQPKPETSQAYGYPQEGSSQGPAQPLQKPKRSSANQFGSVFAPGSANSVSKLTNMFKKDKKGRQSMDDNQFEQQGALAGAAPQSSQAPSVSSPHTPQRAQATQGQGEVSEVDLWRPQSTEERQQCMDAFDHKGYGRLGGLGEVEARALWTRQNMPPDSFRQVWHLSDMDSNHLLSKPEFCLFMYLMHALRNFGASFHLPEHITPTQAAKILGLEGMVRGAGGSAGAPQVGPSSQGYNPAQAHSGNGGLQGTQQYPQQEPQQIGANDWEATGGMSPSQQQAVQEMTALGFSAQQSQEALEAHRWNRNAAANWLLQGGSSQSQGGSSLPPTPRPAALRRSTTERSSYVSSGSGAGGQSLRHTGSGIGRFNHGHTSSSASTADWGSGNYSPTSAGEYSQPGSARTTGDSIPGTGVQFGSPGSTPRSSSRVPATGNARLSLTVRKARMDYRGSMEKPFFTLSIRARGGTPLELSQDTPPGMFGNGVMHLDHTLVLSTPIEKIPQGSVLFFELKHWKPREKKFSLRGWALVAVSSLVDYSGSVPQLQTGTMKLSMLQKPVDLMLSRKHKRLSPEGFDLEVNVNIA